MADDAESRFKEEMNATSSRITEAFKEAAKLTRPTWIDELAKPTDLTKHFDEADLLGVRPMPYPLPDDIEIEPPANARQADAIIERMDRSDEKSDRSFCVSIASIVIAILSLAVAALSSLHSFDLV